MAVYPKFDIFKYNRCVFKGSICSQYEIKHNIILNTLSRDVSSIPGIFYKSKREKVWDTIHSLECIPHAPDPCCIPKGKCVSLPKCKETGLIHWWNMHESERNYWRL